MRRRGMARRFAPAALGVAAAAVAVAAAVGLAARLPALGAGGDSGLTPVAEVNGDVVIAAELNYYARQHRAGVAEHYMREYGTDYDGSFWQREMDGATPAEELYERALNDAVRMKVELQLAREHNLVEDVAYDALMREMERENARRAAAVERGEPIYGPARFEESAFIDFYRGKIKTWLKEALAETVLRPSEEQLLAFYESALPELYPAEDRLLYDKLTVAYRHAGEDEAGLKREALAAAELIREHLEAGGAPAEAGSALPQPSGGIAAAYEGEHVLEEANASRLFKSEHALYAALRGASASELPAVLPVIDDAAAGRYVIVRVKEREAARQIGYEEVREQVRKVYLESAYEEYIGTVAQSARVELLPAFGDSLLPLGE